MTDTARELMGQANTLFEKRFGLLSLWQTMAENFYPERADFTRHRNLGEEFASNLLSSYPLMARRDLQGVIASMLRRDKWFSLGTGRETEKASAKKWLEHSDSIMRKLMAERTSGFDKATSSADGDFVTFGNAVLSVELNSARNGILYRCWHPRDVAWSEDEAGMVDCVYRKWKPQARELVKLFPDTVSHETRTTASNAPFTEVQAMHIVCPAEMLGGEYKEKLNDAPFASVYIDMAGQAILEMTGIHNKMYVIPRWQQVSGSQYAYSPSSVAALPDARLIQAMTNTLLEAGEKFTNPPMIATQDAIRSDIQVFAGGITWVDDSYDERLGDVLRPLNQDRGGMPMGFDMAADVRSQIDTAFYLDKLRLPDTRAMTAYEVSERMQEFVRSTLPLFGPMEKEYNGQLCDITFDIAMRSGFLGSEQDIPDELRGEEVEFTFQSPIAEAVEKTKGQLFMQTAEMLQVAAQADPGAVHDVDVSTAFRDALQGIGVPATWIADEDVAAQSKQAAQIAQAAQMAAESGLLNAETGQ
tara:strand:- start:13230 stop:14816 length:1587 start_codon:yes stop_codon:yes gene_type:complete